MDAAPDIAFVAQLIADPARARMLSRLLDGKALTATELARHADVTPQTASSHLSKLHKGNLLALEKQGRHRYYRLAGPAVSQAIEALMGVAPRSTNNAGLVDMAPIELARTCYDHIAGHLGVALADSMIQLGWLVPAKRDYHLTQLGEKHLLDFGLELPALRLKRRQFARQCLDWTERRHHVGGALGAAIAESLLNRGWLLRNPDERVVHITNSGITGLRKVFGVRI